MDAFAHGPTAAVKLKTPFSSAHRPGVPTVQKSVLLATIQKEIQRHDLSYSVDEPPSMSWCRGRWLSGVQEENQYDATVSGSFDERGNAQSD